MIILAISLLLVLVILAGAYLISASADTQPSTTDRVSTVFRPVHPRSQGRSPLMLAARRISAVAGDVAEESSRITSSSFRVFREPSQRFGASGNA